MSNLFLDMGNMLPVSERDLNANDLTANAPLGSIAFRRDAFGFRVFKYCRNLSGSAIAQGELQKRVADGTISNATSGTTTSVTKTGAALTASALKGRILYVEDNDDSAGAAPEGEASPIVANGTETITVDSRMPFTVAVAANDELRYWTFDHLVDAADSDLASKVVGVCVGTGGVSDNYHGWWQIHGPCPGVIHTAATVTSLNPVVAGAAAVAAHGSDAVDLWVGYQLGTHTSDVVALKSPVYVQLFGSIRPIA